jgi:predicted CoA-binding protein
MRTNDPEAIRRILQQARTIAVVGLSSKPTRPSYGVARYLQSEGYRIVPVNPNEVEVLGERAYARLADVPERVDVVTIFRRSEAVLPIVEDAIRIGAWAVWMQEGVVHEEAARRAQQAGLLVVMNRCMLKEHRKLTMSRREDAAPLPYA